MAPKPGPSQSLSSSGSGSRRPRSQSPSKSLEFSLPSSQSQSSKKRRVPMASGLPMRVPMASELPMSVQTNSCLKMSKSTWLDEAKGLNFVFSPFSVCAALSLLAYGSNGRTLEQILSFLKSTSLDHLNSVAPQLSDLVDGTKNVNGGGAINLSFVSGIWVDDSCTLKPHYKEIANTIYKAEAETVDFKTKADEVRKTVNQWVEKETNGLIKDLLPARSINHKTRVVLANALYFKGKWEQEFDSSKTKKSEFYLLDGGSVKVPFMTNYRTQYVSRFDGFKVLQLPYQQHVSRNDPHQRHFSLYIFLPNERDELGGLIEKVSSDPGFIDRHLPNTKVPVGEFRIPKFKISFGFEASTVLKKLGLVLPFDKNQAKFEEMVDGCDKLCVSSVHHKCFVEVDEVGTEAAAATAIPLVLSGCCGCMWAEPPKIDFVADHPFMFIIRENLSGLVLFIGHVLNPSLNV